MLRWHLQGGATALPARCHPKFMVLVGGREDTQSAKRLIMMLAKSVRRWAASVRMARLCARYPPADTGHQGDIVGGHGRGPSLSWAHISSPRATAGSHRVF